MVKRRDFITLLGGAAAGWPVAARGQQAPMPVIGFLDVSSAAERTDVIAAFRLGIADGGYVEGQNVTIEYRWAEGRYDRLPELAADLVRRRVSVIVTPGTTAAALAAKAATATIPIAFGVSGDPVKLGLAARLDRPGGNATGFNFFTLELVSKRMQLLRELVPAAKRIGLLTNPTDPINESALRDVEAAAVGQQILVFQAATGREIDAAFEGLMREKVEALFVTGGGYFDARRVQLAVLAARYGVPATYSVRHFVEAGGADELRNQLCADVSPSRELCRACPQGRQANGPAGGAGD
jgi:putative ABC transport system substrate-binding protein